jgi:hypothetical protein
MASTVYVVHCIDTEGPLHESVAATFERLKAIFNLDLEPNTTLLRRLQAGEVDLGGLESAVQKVIDPHLLAYNDTWDKVDAMLNRIMAPRFRLQVPDTAGNGWIYNWFCVDHVGYGDNPRRRDLGYLNIFDHYQRMIGETDSSLDQLYFHFHPHNFRHEAHRCATHWWSTSDSLFKVLCHRVIERCWFPAVHRPGFHVIRPDSHWFLEQFIPFDYSSQAMVQTTDDTAQFGLAGGRLGDWRRAPVTWEPYHPSADDYQVSGTCRRWIARCLNVGTRFRLLTEQDVRQAFREARAGKPVVLSFTNHDFRDMAPDVDEVRQMLKKVAMEYPDVPFVYADAVTAMRGALRLPVQSPCELDINMQKIDEATHVMVVESRTPTFGPQPWLALKTVTGDYYHDNFDIDVPFHRWQYVFDADTFPLQAMSAIGVAANNAFGVSTVAVFDPATGKVNKKFWNAPDDHIEVFSDEQPE